MKVTNSLPGVKVQEQDVKAVVSTCLPRQYLLQILHLWKSANYNLDLAKGLTRSLRVLRSQEAPRYLVRSLKKISRIIGTTSAHKKYEKMFMSMFQDESCFKAHKQLNEWGREMRKHETMQSTAFQKHKCIIWLKTREKIHKKQKNTAAIGQRKSHLWENVVNEEIPSKAHWVQNYKESIQKVNFFVDLQIIPQANIVIQNLKYQCVGMNLIILKGRKELPQLMCPHICFLETFFSFLFLLPESVEN